MRVWIGLWRKRRKMFCLEDFGIVEGYVLVSALGNVQGQFREWREWMRSLWEGILRSVYLTAFCVKNTFPSPPLCLNNCYMEDRLILFSWLQESELDEQVWNYKEGIFLICDSFINIITKMDFGARRGYPTLRMSAYGWHYCHEEIKTHRSLMDLSDP